MDRIRDGQARAMLAVLFYYDYGRKSDFDVQKVNNQRFFQASLKIFWWSMRKRRQLCLNNGNIQIEIETVEGKIIGKIDECMSYSNKIYKYDQILNLLIDDCKRGYLENFEFGQYLCVSQYFI